MLAIAIPYAGTLGKIFSDILRSTPKKPIESLRKSGASNIQQIVYGIIPANFNQLKSYIFYRFECAIRSSAILSFIGLGGLGYQINISLQDLKYAEVWTFVYTLVVVIIAVDFMGKLSRSESSKKLKYISNRVLTIVFIVSWTYLIFFEKMSLFKILTLKNLNYSMEFLRKLIGLGSESSPYLDISIWLKLIELAGDTIQMSIIALGIHNFGILGKLCAEVIEDYDDTPSKSLYKSGASRLQSFIYGTIPTVYPRFISYVFSPSRTN